MLGEFLHVFGYSWALQQHAHLLGRVVRSHHGVTATIDPVDRGPGAERLFGIGGRHAFHGRVRGKNSVADLAACLAHVVRGWVSLRVQAGSLPVP